MRHTPLFIILVIVIVSLAGCAKLQPLGVVHCVSRGDGASIISFSISLISTGLVK
jgi:hypothetical protein